MNKYLTDAPTAVSAWKNAMMMGYCKGYWDGVTALNSEVKTKDPTPPVQKDLDSIKADIKAFFEINHGKNIDYVDLVEHFDFPLADIVLACDELEKEHQIACVD